MARVIIQNDGTITINERTYRGVTEASLMRLMALYFSTTPNKRGVGRDGYGPTWFDWDSDHSWMKPEYQ